MFFPMIDWSTSFLRGLAKCQWNADPIYSWLQATNWIPLYIGGSWIVTGDSPLCYQRNLCLLNLLLCIGEPVAVRGYYPVAR
ncbi:hypothetical protein HAX54_008441, partial [Datura stramonium]|nr:hypothetical protein [Datura stramonium]